jgi:hypothetical protein
MTAVAILKGFVMSADKSSLEEGGILVALAVMGSPMVFILA